MKKLMLQKLFGYLFLLTLSSCIYDYWKSDDIIHAKGEITSVESMENNLIVKVEIEEGSNAWECYLQVTIDTFLNSGKWLPEPKSFLLSDSCEYLPEYTITIPTNSLIKHQTYYLQLYDRGTFDIGGPNKGSKLLLNKVWEIFIGEKEVLIK